MTMATKWNPCAAWLKWRRRKKREPIPEYLAGVPKPISEPPENSCYDDGETWRHGEIDRECGRNDG